MAVETFNGTFDDAVNLSDVTGLIQAILHVEPEYVEDFDYHRLNPDERLQVRIDKNNAPREMVQRYVHQMSFSQFPPVVTTADERIVDGNTRVKARWEREERFANALVIPIRWEDADEDTKERILLLGKMLNNSNGKPLDRAERRLMVRDAIALGMTERQMTGTIGFPPHIVRAVQRELAGQDALTRVGLNENLLSGGVVAAIGQYTDLHDEPLRDLAQLAADANFGAQETKGLAADVKRAVSDEEALRIIRQAREGNAQRIEDIRRGGAGKPKQSKQLRQRLGFITARDADVLIETNPAEMPEHLEALETAMGVLTTTITRQRELISSNDTVGAGS
jgi:hypothetical protein